MAIDRERTLDEEGVPDLEGPLPEKEATGDPQEGLAPPNDAPAAAVDYGTTAAEQLRPEPLERRLARAEPDTGVAAQAVGRERVQVVDPQGTRDDGEKDLIADEAGVSGALAPEEDALHTEPEPPERR